VGWRVRIDLHSRIRRHCGGDGVFELGREAKKSPGGLRLLKKTGVSGDCVREEMMRPEVLKKQPNIRSY
jgi:hypothetical protein